MPTNYSGRFLLIGIAVVLSVLLIFRHPSRLNDPNLTFIQKTELKPGIDMVGGVSLIYQIQAEPGVRTADLANQVMQALKRRVDPNGLRNLVWRPQGNDRLEIQMPLTPEAAEAPKIKEAFDKAQQALDATNVRPQAVIDAVEHVSGTARRQRLAELAMDSRTRADLFAQLSDTFDQIQELKKNPQNLPLEALVPKLQPLTVSYEQLKPKVEQTNLLASEYESVLEQANSETEAQQKLGSAKLDALKATFSDFPSRLKAMGEMQRQFKDYDTVRLAVTGAADLKRLLQGSGVLEYHILADPVSSNPADLQAMYARMGPGGKGPLPQPGDTMRWMQVDKLEEFDRPGHPQATHEWNGKHYMLVLVTP